MRHLEQDGAKTTKGDPAMGDLIRMPHSELHATIELLDRLGVTPHDFEVLRKASSWSQATTARVHKTDPSVWAALELEDAAVRLGFTPGELRALAGRKDLLQLVRQALCGAAGVGPVIDCDVDPFLPQDWKGVEYHKKGGQFMLDLSNVRLHLSPTQMNGKYIEGNKLRKELASEPVFNANVLDYLLAHPELIPEEWKGKYVFFWGTIYRNSDGYLYVRFLYWHGGAWDWSYVWLDRNFGDLDPAAVLAS